ncbi:MAG: hypothetical protein JWQ27_1412 [Ferruginibacter sp.]|nr:hypothetical protein [Ferruginibacter sp.]
MLPQGINIKERSWLAAIAARKLGSRQVAMVLGKTIHLAGLSRQEFLADERWVKHELCHVKQFADHGFFMFLMKYLYESVRTGYHANKFEAEARAAEEQ